MQDTITMYTKDHCPYCLSAKIFFDNKNIPVKEINLSDKPDELIALKERTQHMTVPQIFIGETFIGGYSDLMEKVQKGELVLK